MKKILLFAFVMAIFISVNAQPEQKEWIKRSNEISMQILSESVQYQPEGASQLGIDGLDDQIVDLSREREQKLDALFLKQVAFVEAKIREERDPLVLQDLNIILDQLKRNQQETELSRKYFVDYFNLPQLMFRSMESILNPQNDAARYPSALVRLRKYTGLEPGFKPITEKAMAMTLESLKNPKLLGPNLAELNNDLGNYDDFTNGIEELFKEFKMEGSEVVLAEVKKQLASYKAFIEKQVMPRANKDFRLPKEVYAQNLIGFGVRWTPEELIQRAQFSYQEIVNEMNALTPLVAKEKGISARDYRDVIRELKKQQFQGEEILPHYLNRAKDLNKLIAEHHIVGLPDRDLKIRLGSVGESAAQPAPHLKPPRLIGNTGEQPEFVLPVEVPAAPGSDEKSSKMDDFTFAAASWTLTVHEGRPGHELQFDHMLSTGVSMARMLFAFNSVNVEGWALYSEAVMKPYMPLEGQFISLQHRLMRATRAFMDPMLQLGLTTPEQAKAYLMDNLVLSEPMARQEVDRYTFRAPGQATSYFYGYTRWIGLRQKAFFALGAQFDQEKFHNFALDQGLLPPELLEKAVVETFIPQQLALGAKTTTLSK